MNDKVWYKSKTLWLQAVTAIVIALWGIIGPYLPISPEQAAALAVAGNVVMRFVTTGPVTLESPAPPIGKAGEKW